MQHNTILACCLILLAGLCDRAFAKPDEADPRPPPAAFAACSAQQAGATCHYDDSRGRVYGLCMAIRGWQLHCAPPHRMAPAKGAPAAKPKERSEKR